MIAPTLLVMVVVPALVVPLLMTGSAAVPAPVINPEFVMMLEPVPVWLRRAPLAVVPPVAVEPAATVRVLLPEPVAVDVTAALPVPVPVTVEFTVTVALPLTADVTM